MTDVTIGIFMRRVGPDHAMQMASLAERTKRSFVLQYIYEEGTAHANINKVIDNCNTRYCCICDDDVEFLDDNWLDTLLNTLKSNNEVGAIVPIEIKTEEQRQSYKANGWNPEVIRPQPLLRECGWLPGYVFLFDRKRTPELRADEGIPGPSGMSDLDLSLQVRAAGYKCVLTAETVVFHRIKPLDPEWREKYDIVQEFELSSLNAQQVAYMRKKWGSFFLEALGRTNARV